MGKLRSAIEKMQSSVLDCPRHARGTPSLNELIQPNSSLEHAIRDLMWGLGWRACSILQQELLVSWVRKDQGSNSTIVPLLGHDLFFESPRPTPSSASGKAGQSMFDTRPLGYPEQI